MKYLDPFLMSLIGAVFLASILPCPVPLQPWLSHITTFLIMFMFFFQGAKLQRRAILESLQDWRLQGATLLISFFIFPLLGLGLYTLCHAIFPQGLLKPTLWTGLLFLCCLPSTIQSSIALTSIARGNVTASICAATVSNIAGIFITPFIAGLLLHRSGESSGIDTILNIGKELLLPFILGQLVQKWIGPIIQKHKILLSFSDRGSIIVMVYAAFSSAVLQGLWHLISPFQLLIVAVLDMILLCFALLITALIGHLMKQSKENDISLQFCGSKKALTTGVSMANVIFPSGVGIVVLPLMLFHQIQLFVCTILARHYAKRSDT